MLSPPPPSGLRCRYQGGRTLNDFLKFIDDKIKADAGFARVAALDALAHKFVAAAVEDKEALIKKAEAVEVSGEVAGGWVRAGWP